MNLASIIPPLAPLTSPSAAWHVGLWPYEGAGHDQQYSGMVGTGACHPVNAMKLGQVTFDGRTRFWTRMHEVVGYGDRSCDPGFEIYDGGQSLAGKDVSPPRLARAFWFSEKVFCWELDSG